MRVDLWTGMWGLLAAAGLSAALLAAPPAEAAAPSAAGRPRDNWDFRYRGFVIGSWWGPGPTDAEMRLYKEAGFNVVMTGRYMQLDDYGDPDKGLQELDLARRHGLWVMFDTYTKNDRPWGGRSGPTDEHPTHHPASLPELQWLYDRLAGHPALLGFMVGDDQGSVSPRSADCTRFLFEQRRPHLIPWLCGWIPPRDLAAHNNPFANPQIYPTLYEWRLPAEDLAQRYAASYASISRQCRDLGVVFWPMLNAAHETHGKTDSDMFGYLPSDSLLRFPAYAAVAYGAEGIWYFTYNGGALQHLGEYRTLEEARKALTPLYPVAKRVNRRIAAWGPRVIGRRSTGLFGTAFGARGSGWPFPEDTQAEDSPERLAPPAKGKLIESMSEDLLVGILTKPRRKPLAVVVDCRVSKSLGDLPSREATLRFHPTVTGVGILEGGSVRKAQGTEVTLSLEPGGGQMLELEGSDLERLCSEEAIYRPAPRPRTRPRRGALTEADLDGIRAAKLRIDVFDSNGEPRFRRKAIEVNGRRIGRVPPNDAASWSLKVVDVAPDQLRHLKLRNQVVVRTECEDAWKLRNLCLAVQLADGTWVKSNTDPTVRSTPGWAHTEGSPWGPEGVAGPVDLVFG